VETRTPSASICVRRALSNANVKFLTDEQALTLQSINGLRDAAQHHLVDISEGHLYLQAQAGVTLYNDLLQTLFGENLRELLPDRVLPIATVAPVDPISLFTEEIEEVARLLAPGKRQRTEALARLRTLSIVDGAIQGERLQPSEYALKQLGQKIIKGAKSIDELFPGIAAITFTTTGSGPMLNLRITKREGIPVQLVQEGNPDASVVGVKRVSELDYYNLRYNDFAKKLNITTNQVTALIALLDIKNNLDYAKEIIHTWCYSPKALEAMKKALSDRSPIEWWAEYKAMRKTSKAKSTRRGNLSVVA
jgi:hypothetical protein